MHTHVRSCTPLLPDTTYLSTVGPVYGGGMIASIFICWSLNSAIFNSDFFTYPALGLFTAITVALWSLGTVS